MISALTLPRAAAAALSLAAIACVAPSASAAVTWQLRYQAMAHLTCSSGCLVKFPKLNANQALKDINHIACEVFAATLGLWRASPFSHSPTSTTRSRCNGSGRTT